jgi:two-component system sensor histidine kinase VanS
MRKDRRIFTSVFLYIMLLLVLMTGGTALLFARQFTAFYREEQMRRLAAAFQPVMNRLEGKTPEEIVAIAEKFSRANESLFFMIEDADGNVLFSTVETPENGEGNAPPMRIRRQREVRTLIRVLRTSEASGGTAGSVPDGTASYILSGAALIPPKSNDSALIYKSVTVLALMLALGIAGAVLFAKRVTKPLEDEVERERRMEENQRTFFSAASHELKTPIAAASALVEGMIANVGDYKDHPTYLRECLKTLQAQNKLVSEIVEIVKLSDDNGAPVFEAVNCKALTDSLCAEYQALAGWNGQTLTSDVPDRTVHADKHLLRRALSNVVSNAVQNTPENGRIRIFGAVISSAKPDGKTLRLSVLNAPAHIAPDTLDRLFEPFYRGDQARNRSAGRSGLGLTIVKKALDRMNIPFSLRNTADGVLFYLDMDMLP